MVTPNPIAQVTYYKAGEYVTFAWNYTSLSVTPSAVDILASCSLNSYTYTIALNQTISNATQAVTWDTSLETAGSNPLLTATYTLIIYDAAKEVTSTPSAGYLDTFNQFTFGMYTPQPYTPLNGLYFVPQTGTFQANLQQNSSARLAAALYLKPKDKHSASWPLPASSQF